MKSIRVLGSMAAALALTACAATPDVTFHYYLPKAETAVTVTESIDCDATKQKLFFVFSVTANTAYSSDAGRPQSIKIKQLAGRFADSALTFNFTDDGRLKSVNATTTGQGEAIVKAAVTMASAIGGAVESITPSKPCATVASWGGGKPVSLIFNARIVYPGNFAGGDIAIPAAAGNEMLYNQLKDYLPALSLHVGAQQPIIPAATPPENLGDAIALTLGNTANIDLAVNTVLNAKSQTIWTGSALVPQAGTYSLPIPKAALFGKQTFILSLNDAGAVTAISYNADSGAAGSENAVTAIATALKRDTTADEIAGIKSQADLIAQQQRLVRCKANPAACN